MFLKLKKGKQKEIVQKAIARAGSERNLCKVIHLTKGSLYRYKNELGNMPKKRFHALLRFLHIPAKQYNQYIIEELPENWGKIKGGVNCIAKKRRDGTFQETVERLRKVSSKRMKQWHKDMKEKSPREYHIWQYERFKKIRGGYAHSLINSTKVRNLLEKRIGDFLLINGFKFEYEPYININGKVYFPDFKLGNKIIEVTEWKHPDKSKIQLLKRKIKDYRKNGFEVVFFIPGSVRKFYKAIQGSFVSALPELKSFLMPS